MTIFLFDQRFDMSHSEFKQKKIKFTRNLFYHIFIQII